MNEVFPKLWLGDKEHCKEAASKGMVCICVSETPFPDVCSDTCKHSPILVAPKNIQGADKLTKEEYRAQAYVNHEWLNETLQLITRHYGVDTIYLHCSAGVERSPLVASKWISSELKIGLLDAFDFIQKRRPIIQNRFYWLYTPDKRT